MNESSTVRPAHLRRLFSEFVVIVLGVLIALAADSWRQGLQDRDRLLTHLTALQADLAATSRELDDALEEDSLTLVSVLMVVDDLRIGTATGTPGERGRFYWSSWEPRVGAVNTLIHTGDISLLEAGALQQGIERYESAVVAVRRWLSGSDRSMWDNLREANAVGETLANRAGTTFGMDASATRFGADLLKGIAYDVLRANPDVSGLYSFHALGLQNRLWAVAEFRGPLAQLQLLVEQEIQRLSQ